MTVLDIMIHPHPVLREICKEVQRFDSALHQLLDQMAETMYAANGVGLAANQINSTQRLVVIDAQREERGKELLELINPQITAYLGNRVVGEEGCLSIPDIYENVERYEAIQLKAQDRYGQPFEMKAEEFLAIVIQHEIDHLNGILFIDQLSRLRQGMIKRKMQKRFGKQDLRRHIEKE
jgi:peptide deformylase